MTGSIDRQRGSGRPRSARTPANINEVDSLALSQEDKPQTHSSQQKIARRKVILKAGEVVCSLLSLKSNEIFRENGFYRESSLDFGQ